MADVSIISDNVRVQIGANDPPVEKVFYTASEVIDAGEIVYVDDFAARTVSLADANDIAKSDVLGMAHNVARIGQDVAVITSGRVFLSIFVVSKGVSYYLSQNAPGKIAPWADLNASDVVALIGIASSLDDIDLYVRPTGILI